MTLKQRKHDMIATHEMPKLVGKYICRKESCYHCYMHINSIELADSDYSVTDSYKSERKFVACGPAIYITMFKTERHYRIVSHATFNLDETYDETTEEEYQKNLLEAIKHF